MPTTNLSDAIVAYQAQAAALFDDAQSKLISPLNEDVKKQYQGQLAAAFSQLKNAETMRSAQLGREGYADVVALMGSTSTTAAVICGELKTLAVIASPSTAEYQRMDALMKALDALAQMSPVPVWEKGWTPDGPAG